MSDSNGNNESIIFKIRLKNLYSYSKQSLAPAVSTVGFSLLIECMQNSVFHNLDKVRVFIKKCFFLSAIDAYHHTYGQYLIFDFWTNQLMN